MNWTAVNSLTFIDPWMPPWCVAFFVYSLPFSTYHILKGSTQKFEPIDCKWVIHINRNYRVSWVSDWSVEVISVVSLTHMGLPLVETWTIQGSKYCRHNYIIPKIRLIESEVSVSRPLWPHPLPINIDSQAAKGQNIRSFILQLVCCKSVSHSGWFHKEEETTFILNMTESS